MIRVMVASDDPDLRVLLRTVLSLDAEFTLCAVAVDGTDAFEKWVTMNPKPDVILTGNRMPRLDGLELTARILRDAPDQAVVLFTPFLDDQLLDDAERVGVAGCIDKEQLFALSDLIRAIWIGRLVDRVVQGGHRHPSRYNSGAEFAG